MTIQQFIASANLTLTSSLTDSNPSMDDVQSPMTHWKVTLKAGKSRMTLTFSKGLGHRMQPPTVAEVLDCLASDASSIQGNVDFDDWCHEMGFDTDSRKAHKTYREVERFTAKLRKLLGDSAFNTLLKVDRL